MKLLELLDEIKIVPAERFPVEVGDIWDLEYASNKLAYVTQIKETPKNYRIFFEKVKFDEEGNIINRYTDDDLLDKGYFISSDSPYRFKKRVESIKNAFLSNKRFYFNDYISKFRDKEKLDFFTFRELVNNLDLPKEQYDSIAKKAIELIKKIQKANVREEAEVYANEKYEQYKNALKNLSQQIPADFSILSDLLNEIKVKPTIQPLKIYYTAFTDDELVELGFRFEDKYFEIKNYDFPINYDESADILGFLTTDSNLVDFLKGLDEGYGIEVDEVLDLGDVKIKNISTNPNIIFKVKYY
jgi:hypothetical protein